MRAIDMMKKEEKPQFTPYESDNTVVSTRWKAWYLVTLKGYSVELTRRIPRMNSLGQIIYVSEWHLRPPTD